MSEDEDDEDEDDREEKVGEESAKAPAAEDEEGVQVYRYLLIVYLINNYVSESRRRYCGAC